MVAARGRNIWRRQSGVWVGDGGGVVGECGILITPKV